MVSITSYHIRLFCSLIPLATAYSRFATHTVGRCVPQRKLCIQTSWFVWPLIPRGCFGWYWPQRSPYPLYKYLTCYRRICYFPVLPSSYSCRTSFVCFMLIKSRSARRGGEGGNEYYLAHVRLSKRNGALTYRCKWIRMFLASLTLHKRSTEICKNRTNF